MFKLTLANGSPIWVLFYNIHSIQDAVSFYRNELITIVGTTDEYKESKIAHLTKDVKSVIKYGIVMSNNYGYIAVQETPEFISDKINFSLPRMGN